MYNWPYFLFSFVGPKLLIILIQMYKFQVDIIENSPMYVHYSEDKNWNCRWQYNKCTVYFSSTNFVKLSLTMSALNILSISTSGSVQIEH